jgi:peptidoglycan/LPS O-acetylase OafA/YrhL
VRVRGPIVEGLAGSARQPGIEGFRGVVVTAVVGYHLVRLLLTRGGGSWGSTAPDGLLWVATARFGVDAFFVLAGAFVTASWRSCRRRAGGWRPAVADFAGRRGRRILPAFWVAGAVFGGQALLAGRIDWGDLALLASTQQYLEPYLPAAVDLPMWSLTTEVQFYVVAPLVAALAPRRVGVLLLAVTLVTSTWWHEWPGRGDLAAGLLPGRLDQFVTGALVGVLASRWRAGERPWPARLALAPGAGWALVAGLLALGVFHGATFQRGDDSWLEHALHPAAGLVLGGLVLRLLCGRRVALLEHRAWRFLGLVSYSLYLWHYPILDHGFEHLGLRDPGTSVLHVVAVVALLLATALAVATVSFALVEHRFAARWGPPGGRSAVRQAELRLQDAVEVPRSERHEAGGDR